MDDLLVISISGVADVSLSCFSGKNIPVCRCMKTLKIARSFQSKQGLCRKQRQFCDIRSFEAYVLNQFLKIKKPGWKTSRA
jgi:hypothetical protein